MGQVGIGRGDLGGAVGRTRVGVWGGGAGLEMMLLTDKRREGMQELGGPIISDASTSCRRISGEPISLLPCELRQIVQLSRYEHLRSHDHARKIDQ